MAEVHETYVEKSRGGGWAALIAFLIGGILIGAVAVLLMNMHGTISWPAGRLDFNLRPDVAPFTQPAPTQQALQIIPTVVQIGPRVVQSAPQNGPSVPSVPEAANASPAPQTAPQEAP